MIFPPTSKVPAVVTEVLVTEGQSVSKGQILLDHDAIDQDTNIFGNNYWYHSWYYRTHGTYKNIEYIVIDGGSTDNCGVTLTLSQTAFTCANIGGNSVTLTGTDASGNTSTCTATVTVIDNTAPTVICKADTVYLKLLEIVKNGRDDGKNILPLMLKNEAKSPNKHITFITVINYKQ